MPKRGKSGKGKKKGGRKKAGGAHKGRDGSPERIEQRAREMMEEGARQSGDNSWFTIMKKTFVKSSASPFIDWEHLSRWGGRQQGVFCNHGCPKLPFQGHGVSFFLDSLMLTLSSREDQFVGIDLEGWQVMMLTSRMSDHGGVWSNESHRKMATNILLAIATNIILRGESPDLAAVFAIHALFFEECGTKSHGPFIAAEQDVSAKVLRLLDGNERDVIRYLASKIRCNCLYEKYEESKALGKVAVCFHCKEEKERNTLMVCATCKVASYCSPRCQAEGWKDHKQQCATMFGGDKQFADMLRGA